MSYHVTSQKKAFIEHKEGDIWEESGKTWTIKNGIKKTVTKMESLRKQIITPIACPKCKVPNMKSQVHKWAWNTYRMCFNCVVDMEHEITKAGKLEEYTNALYKANMESMYDDLEQFVKDFAKQKTVVYTEDGVKENWIDDTQQTIEQIGNSELHQLKLNIEKINA